MTPDDTEFMTVKEMANRLRVSTMTVYRLIQRGSIRSARFGRSFRIHRGDALAYIKDSQVIPPKT